MEDRETERFEHFLDGGGTSGKLVGGKGFLAWQVAVGRARDSLGVVRLPILLQQVPARWPKLIFFKKGIAPKLIEFVDCFGDGQFREI